MRKITDEEIAPSKSSFEVGVHFLLIFRAVLKKHPEIAGSKISGEPTAEIFLEHVSAGFAQLAQICMAGENYSLIFRQCLVPGRAARDLANTRGQLFVAERNAVRIQEREFTELHRGARHDEAGAAVLARRIVRCRSSFQGWTPVFILEHGRVLECKCVALETEGRRESGAGCQREKHADSE